MQHERERGLRKKEKSPRQTQISFTLNAERLVLALQVQAPRPFGGQTSCKQLTSFLRSLYGRDVNEIRLSQTQSIKNKTKYARNPAHETDLLLSDLGRAEVANHHFFFYPVT